MMSPEATAYMKQVLRMVAISKMDFVHRRARRKRMLAGAMGRVR
jgi:hypothetical protein